MDKLFLARQFVYVSLCSNTKACNSCEALVGRTHDLEVSLQISSGRNRLLKGMQIF